MRDLRGGDPLLMLMTRAGELITRFWMEVIETPRKPQVVAC